MKSAAEFSDKTIELSSTIRDGFDRPNLRDTRVIKVEQEFENIVDNGNNDEEETPLKDVKQSIPSVLKISGDENAISDPLTHIPTDLTFEDEGIKWFNEEIQVNVKSESRASTPDDLINIEEPIEIDRKLLMQTCVYTIKLEDMTAFRNKNIHELRDQISIETAFRESKMYVKKKQIKDINNEHKNKSVMSEIISDNDSSDSEYSITEKNKVKLSSYMLQKPKSRSYNPIQLCKNPDFNTRLKRLTAGFLSSSRNRLLLKCLKPMTIDLSKAFESKLINGTVYLKLDDGSRIKCDKVSDEPSVMAVLPSAMPVQSLIDNSSRNLQHLLPLSPMLTTKSNDLLSKRQKTVNLPDINKIHRINQHLLTAEVTPTKRQSIPPIGSTEAVSDLSTAPVEKKKKECTRVTYNSLSWNKNVPSKPKVLDEFLLTLDTLNKMLLMFDNVECTAKTSRGWNKSTEQKNLLQNRMEQFQKMIENAANEPDGDDGADEKAISPTDSNKKKKKKEPPQEPPQEPKLVTPKINIVTKASYGSFCCWARMKLRTDGKRAVRPHQCPRICRCCCRDALIKVFNPPPRLVRPIIVKRSSIIIPYDKETKKMCDSINTVVDQSQNLLAPIDKAIGSTTLRDNRISRTEVSTQCDLNPCFDLKKNRASEKAQYSVETLRLIKPHQSKDITIHEADMSTHKKSKTLRPGPVRNDLSMHPAYRPPILPDMYHRHININNSRQKVQIHHEPVNFNNKQKSKYIPSPVFLGQNKMLLTDIKFPSTDPAELTLQSTKPSDIAIASEPPVPAALPEEPHVVPLAMPSGVQVILLPDGQLTYIIDPGATLTDEEIAAIPVILDAIRQQLNKTSATKRVPSATSEIDLTDERAAQTGASSDTYANANMTSNIDSVDGATIEQHTQKSKAVLSNIENVKENSDAYQLQDVQDKNEIVANEPINIPENVHENRNITTNYTAKSNRKTLLSDLMEMSGISEEDIEINGPAHIENTRVQTEIVPEAPVIESADVPKVKNTPVLHGSQVSSGQMMPSICELTPITSYSQLKYACEHKGTFFKFDFKLGTLVKIDVSIKKTKPKRPLPLHRLQKYVIDLTGDEDLSPDKATKMARQIKSKSNQDVSLDEATLPEHVIQSNKYHVSPHEEIFPATVKTNRSLLSNNKDTRMPLKVTTNFGRGLPVNVSVYVKQKRKQELDQSQVLDSELETEVNSVDSVKLDKYAKSGLVSDSDGDMSDDDPLAHKTKRMRVNEIQQESNSNIINEGSAVARQDEEEEMEEEWLLSEEEIAGEEILRQDEQGTHIAKETNITKNDDITKAIDSTEEVASEGEFMSEEEVPIEGELNLQPELQLVKSMDEDGSDNDCILGF